ncbi:MAG: hydantoinase B/oxoprolinase family protein [Acetobacteraceae bacterium]
MVEEQGQVLIRTAFSPIVRECGDISAGVFDLQGRMLAQAVTGTPGHINSMAESVKHFIRAFPIETMKEGDTYICNDPWLGTGHLNDFVVTTRFSCAGASSPCSPAPATWWISAASMGRTHATSSWRGSTSHAEADRPGGGERDADGDDPRQYAAADRYRSDTYSLAGCNEVGVRRLVDMMEGVPGSMPGRAGRLHHDRSRAAVMAEIAKLPKGTWDYTMTADG